LPCKYYQVIEMPVYEMRIAIGMKEKENMEKARDRIKLCLKDLKEEQVIEEGIWHIREMASAKLYKESGEV